MVDVIVILISSAIYNIILGSVTLGLAYIALVNLIEKDWFEGTLCTIGAVIVCLTWILANYLMFFT